MESGRKWSPRVQARIDAAVGSELAKLARVTGNLEAAHENGLISLHDRDERIARAEQEAENRVAWIKGEKRPRQRETQPLDDPNAGRVG